MRFEFLFAQLINIALLAVWIGLGIVALRRLVKMTISLTKRLAWLIVILIPVIGPGIFLILNDQEDG